MVDCICVGSNVVTVLANCVDVVLVGVIVVVVQVVVHVGHQVEHEKGEGHKVKGVEAIVALSSRATWAVNENLFIFHFSVAYQFLFSPCVAIAQGPRRRDFGILGFCSKVQYLVLLVCVPVLLAFFDRNPHFCCTGMVGEQLCLETSTEMFRSDQLIIFGMSRQHLLQSHPGTSPVVGGQVFPRVLSPVVASPQVPLGSEEVQGQPGGEHTSLAGNRSSPG